MKSKCEQMVSGAYEEVLEDSSCVYKEINARKMGACILTCLIGILLVVGCGIFKGLNGVSTSETAMVSLEPAPIAATSGGKSVITIPVGKVNANPFLPYRDIKSSAVVDVPAYNLVEPPEAVGTSSEAARVMDTIVSGILYDKYSPSAILNIEGNDYLVKKGDVVNNYKVMSITQDSVTVKLGANVYKAGIGEILTEGTINYNEVSNLGNKFGGVNNELQ